MGRVGPQETQRSPNPGPLGFQWLFGEPLGALPGGRPRPRRDPGESPRVQKDAQERPRSGPEGILIIPKMPPRSPTSSTSEVSTSTQMLFQITFPKGWPKALVERSFETALRKNNKRSLAQWPVLGAQPHWRSGHWAVEAQEGAVERSAGRRSKQVR